MDLESLRKELAAKRGQWGALAELAGISRKTVERIVHEDGYMPNLRTMIALRSALQGAPKAAA